MTSIVKIDSLKVPSKPRSFPSSILSKHRPPNPIVTYIPSNLPAMVRSSSLGQKTNDKSGSSRFRWGGLSSSRTGAGVRDLVRTSTDDNSRNKLKKLARNVNWAVSAALCKAGACYRRISLSKHVLILPLEVGTFSESVKIVKEMYDAYVKDAENYGQNANEGGEDGYTPSFQDIKTCLKSLTRTVATLGNTEDVSRPFIYLFTSSLDELARTWEITKDYKREGPEEKCEENSDSDVEYTEEEIMEMRRRFKEIEE
ncbi:hypothetical protein TIFTF001_003742 [Ficus carica]|uniref:phosphopyruvate hydratase n=1 Tax=Ficus carica TaxID=3494 RepID=A0AA88CWI9_FICCA|nr:hypothetical protein TIFTF001_003742 [Ficus carica]